MLVQRWAILQSAMPRRITIKKTIAMVNALAKLHNFCIDQNEVDVPESSPSDAFNLMNSEAGFVSFETTTNCEVPLPSQLIGGGEHFDDIYREGRRTRGIRAEVELPRDELLEKVVQSHMQRPHINIYR